MVLVESYSKALQNTQLISKVSSFLIALLVFIEILYLHFRLLNNQNLFSEILNDTVFGVLFLILIFSSFALRFTFLWLRNANYVLLTQFLWLFGWLAIFAYKLVTAKILFGSFWGRTSTGCLDCFYSETFLIASKSLVVFLLAYLISSPIKQLAVFIYSFSTKE
jgi:hypothetical protein